MRPCQRFCVENGSGGKQINYTASIVIYQTPVDLLRQAIASLQHDVPPIRLVVIDNSPEPLPDDLFDRAVVRYVWTGTNLGYGKGHNRALDLLLADNLSAPFHLIMNPDVTVHPGAISCLLKHLEEHGKAGMAVPRVSGKDGTLQPLNKRTPAVIDLALRFSVPHRLRWIFQKRMDRYEMRDIGYDHPCTVESASGCFMLCRTDGLSAVGGFDPRYFMYLEDFDLCRSMRQAGYAVWYVPDALITHLWERASHKQLKMTIAHIASAIRYFRKWGWRFI